MSRKYIVIFIILVFSAAASADTIEGSYIIEYEQPQGFTTMSHGQMDQGIQQALENAEKKHSYSNVFQGSSIEHASQQEIERIEELSFVKEVHQSQRYELLTEDSYEIINADQIGFDSGREPELTGEGMKISIIDSGLDYTHEAFGSCEWDEDTELEDCDKVAEWEDFTDDTNSDPKEVDDPEHGTHVSGTASGNASSFKGIAPESQIFAYNTFYENEEGSLTASNSDIMAAIDESVANDADIISMSLGARCGELSDPVIDSVESAHSQGVLPVVAAGNDGSDAVTGFYPCGQEEESIASPGTSDKALTVGASNKNEGIASFSSRGPVRGTGEYISKPDVVAPGVSVNSAVPGGGYDEKQGTSMATPVVSGSAALLLQQEERQPDEIKKLLMDTADDLGAQPWEQGAGRINVERAVNENSVILEEPTIDFRTVTESEDASKTVEITNPTDQEVTVDIGFGQDYNMTDLSNIETVDLFQASENQLTLASGETNNFEITASSADDSYIASELWVNTTDNSHEMSRPVSGYINLEGSSFSYSVEEDGQEVLAGERWIYGGEEPVELDDPSGTMDIDPGEYTFVAGQTESPEDEKFLYAEEFEVQEGVHETINLEVTGLPEYSVDNTVDGEEMEAEFFKLWYDIDGSLESLPRIEETFEGDTTLRMEGVEFLEGYQAVLQSRFPTDDVDDSEFYIYNWNKSESDNLEMERSFETETLENNPLSSPDFPPFFGATGNYSEAGFFVADITLQDVIINYDANNLEDFTTEWSMGQLSSSEAGGFPVLVSEISIENDKLFWNYLVEDGEGNGLEETITSQDVDLEIDGSETSSDDYWTDFEQEVTEDTVNFSATLPADISLQDRIEIDAEVENKDTTLPRVTSIENYEPKIDSEWSADLHLSEEVDAEAFKREEGSWTSLAEESTDLLNVQASPEENLDLRISLQRTSNSDKVNYTFYNLSKQPLSLESELEEQEDNITGNITLDVSDVNDIVLQNKINDEVESRHISEDLSVPVEQCHLRSQALNWDGYAHYEFYHQVSESESLTPEFGYDEVNLVETQNNISVGLEDDCGFDYQLATNETGDMENRTIEKSEVDGDKVFEWENNSIEAEETIEFELWLGEDDEWYSSDTESFTVAEPSFVQTGLFIDDQVVEEEEFNVSSEIENIGGIEGNFTADLTIQDTGIDVTEEVLIDSGEKVNITFTETIDEPGNYDAESVNETVNFDVLNSAEFEITEPSINTTEIFTGQTVELSANVENIGEVAGNTSLVFSVGSEEQNQTLELEAGETENVHENITVNEEGTFTPSINDSETEQLEVNEPFVNITDTEIITTDSGLITVNATLNNTDPASTTKELELEFNDTVQKTENFGLESEEEKNVTLEKNWNRTELKTVKLNGEEIGEFQLDPFAEFKNLEPDSEAFDEDEVVEFTVDVEAVGEGTVNVDTANNVYEENLDPGLNSFEYEESFSPGEYDWFAEAEIQEEIFESDLLFFDIDEVTDDSDDGGSSGSGDGGGSGAPSAAPDPEIILEQEDDSVRILDIFEGEHDLEFNDTQLPVTGLTFTAEEEGNIEFDATELEHTGSMESLFEVDTELENSFTLEYKVSREWLNETNFESGDISLYRWEESWNDQGSETTGGDEDYIHYRTELDSFSTFGIGSSQACYSMEEVDAVADNSCETYGNICEVSEEAETVDSCQNWERENEVRDRISQIRDEGGDEETLEQAEQAVETGDFEEAENLTEQAQQSGPEIPRITSSTIPVLPLIALFVGLTGLTAAGYKLIPVYREKKLVKRINRLTAKVTEKGNKGEEVQELAEKVGRANKALLRENYGMAEKLVDQAESSLDKE